MGDLTGDVVEGALRASLERERKLTEALRPFAEFAETLLEWRTSRDLLYRAAWPQHHPVLRGTRPLDEETVRVRTVRVDQFLTAAALIPEVWADVTGRKISESEGG